MNKGLKYRPLSLKGKEI